MPSEADEKNGCENVRRFLTLERADGKAAGMSGVSPFVVKQILDSIGKLNISLLRDHRILIETNTQEKMEKVLAIEEMGKVPIKVSHHPKLNLSRGVVKCWHFTECNLEELLQEDKMKAQKVVGLRQIKRHLTDAEEAKCYTAKVKPVRKDTGLFIVTFDTPDLPKTLDVGYSVVEVKLYIPKPLRCFQCHRLGHAQISCKNKNAQKKENNEPVIKGKGKGKKKKIIPCVNCSGNHESWSKTCPMYENECQILRFQAENQVNYGTAKILVNFIGKCTNDLSAAKAKAAALKGAALANGKPAVGGKSVCNSGCREHQEKTSEGQKTKKKTGQKF
ncbi:hypothetical protein DMENIID0001_131690 [Sergentomyia squamirostris]